METIEQYLNSDEILHMFDDLKQREIDLNVEGNEASPVLFEDFLKRYAEKVGTIINLFIPQGTRPDMETYLYGPLMGLQQKWW